MSSKCVNLMQMECDTGDTGLICEMICVDE